MTNYHFWRGNLVRLRAIEQKDLDGVAQSFAAIDTEAEGYVSEISVPVSRAQDRADMEKLRNREPGDDSFFWIIENLEGEVVGSINTFDCERRAGIFKYAILIHRPYWRGGLSGFAAGWSFRYSSLAALLC